MVSLWLSLLNKNLPPWLSLRKVIGSGLSRVGLVGGRLWDARDVSRPGGQVDRLHGGHLPHQAGVVDHDSSDGRALSGWRRAVLAKAEADRLAELVVQSWALPHHHGGGSSPS